MTRLSMVVLLVVGASTSNGFCQGFLQLSGTQAKPLAEVIDAFRKPESLYYESDYKWTWSHADEQFTSHFKYRCWLKKTNLFRVEIMEAGSGDIKGVLVGDGERQWFYWPNGRPKFQWEDRDDFAKAYERNKLTSYRTKLAPLGQHSISHEVTNVGGMFLTVFDPSTFHGHVDSLLAILDGVKRAGDMKVNGHDCEVIDASFSKKQRSWRLVVSKSDSLPRKLTAKHDREAGMTIEETWSDVAVGISIPNSRFQWEPPAGWTELKEPPIEAGFLRPGTEAPDFAMKSLQGKEVKLSDFRGKNVWLFKWRIG